MDSKDFEKLKEQTECIRNYINKFEELPELHKKEEVSGEACACAYPILGIEKYLGMFDKNLRIAYFPSVSIGHDALKTITYVKFEPILEKDLVIIGGEKKTGREKERVLQMVDAFRRSNKIKTKVIVISKNKFKEGAVGKGLGTSASGGAALAKALIAAYDKTGDLSENSRLISMYARLLSGSACRSAVGGIAVWFSYPNIKPEDSYAIRLDDNIDSIKLVAVPIPLKLKTEDVHKEAVASPFYEKWVMEKPKHVFELIKAVENKEIARIGLHAEKDTRRLRAVIMTGPNGTIAWEPETIKLMQLSKELQNNGIPAYYSIDTGPSVFFITSSEYAKEIKSAAEDVLNGKYPVLEVDIAGKAELASKKEKEDLLDSILEKYKIFI